MNVYSFNLKQIALLNASLWARVSTFWAMLFFLMGVSMTPQIVFGLCVKGASANLRGGPGNKFAITWTVQKHMPLAEVKRQGSWIQVKDVDGETHWVYRTLVSSTAQCLVVKSKIANLRQGPGKRYPLAKLKTADRYFAFKKLDSENGWYKIDTGGLGLAWIHEKLVWRALRVQKIGF